jgi:phage gpG-like protein
MNAQIKINYNGQSPKQMKERFERFVRTELPIIVGREAVNFFKDRFRMGGWIDTSFNKWLPRDVNAPRNSGRALLVDSGKLRNSIRVVEQGSNYVVIGSDMPYAQAHNEGFNGQVTIKAHRRKNKFADKFSATKGKEMKRTTKIAWKVNASGVSFVQSHARKMNVPKRQFMGGSEFLFKRINLIVNKRINEIFNQ